MDTNSHVLFASSIKDIVSYSVKDFASYSLAMHTCYNTRIFYKNWTIQQKCRNKEGIERDRRQTLPQSKCIKKHTYFIVIIVQQCRVVILSVVFLVHFVPALLPYFYY